MLIKKLLDLIDNSSEEIAVRWKEEIKKSDITYITDVRPPDLEVSADEELIEQVLINLIKNSIHALEGRKNSRIEVKGFTNKRGRTTIQVMDNGPGILPDVLDTIINFSMHPG